MPYINQDERDRLDPLVKKLNIQITGGGQMNYVITRLLWSWWKMAPSYFSVCKIMGTLVCVGFEFYRRVAAPYEDHKRSENGDVYSYE